MKLFTFVFTTLFVLFIVIVMTGFYPVAIVDDTPVFQRTWKKAEDAAKNFTVAGQASSGKGINFASLESKDLVLDIKRGTLTFLIEDLILEKEGGKVIDGFERLSKERVETALQQGENVEQAARLVYGLDPKDFKNLVLFPQARRDVLKEALREKGDDFDVWFLQIKKSKRVRLMFVSFTWDGEMVK